MITESCLVFHLMMSVCLFLKNVCGGHGLGQALAQCYTGYRGGPDRHGLCLPGAHDLMGRETYGVLARRRVEEGTSGGPEFIWKESRNVSLRNYVWAVKNGERTAGKSRLVEGTRVDH